MDLLEKCSKQFRALRLQLQERVRTEVNSNHCIFLWIVKHSQFLLNRFLTQEDGHTFFTSVDGNGTIREHYVNLEKLFCSVCLEN